MTIRLFLLLSISVVLVAQSSEPAESQTAPIVAEPPVLVVVDTSGSMADPGTDGKKKIEGAGEALASMIRSAPGSTRVGIWTYPAGGGCDAGVLSTPIQPVVGLSAENIASSWVATGNTPTAPSLRAAAEEIQKHQGRSIILVSDGESTCGGDPCEVAQELVAEGFEIQVHTVGLAISDAGRDELLCIAGATGGTYADALDSPNLGDILSRLAEVSMVVSADAEVEAAVDASDRVTVALEATVTNNGVVSARGIEVTLRFLGDERIGLLDATRRFPIVAPNTPTPITWRFEAPLDCEAYDIEYEVLVRRGGILEAQTTARISVPTGLQNTVACLLRTGNVAILGDSYSSGEGAPEYDTGTNTAYNRCRRGQTYGRADRSPDGLTVLACSGAIVNDLLVPQGNHKDSAGAPIGSQLEQLAAIKDEVDVVLLTISGNDLGFSSIAVECLDPRHRCTELTESSLLDALDAIESGLKITLPRVLRILDTKVNSNREEPIQFVVLPYVSLLGGLQSENDCEVPVINSTGEEVAFTAITAATTPFTGVLGWLVTLGATSSLLRIDEQESEGIRQFQSRLNSELAATTQLLRSEGRPFHFASSVSSAAQDHSLCDPEPWGHPVLAIDALGSKISDRPSESFHPNNEGYRGVWRALLSDARGWPILNRNVPNEFEISIGSLCDENGDYKTFSVDDPELAEVRSGECIAIKGGMAALDWFSAKQDPDQISWIAVYIQSDPELLGVAYPDENGEFYKVLWIPDDLALGKHTLSVVAADSEGSLDVVHVPVRVVDEQTSPYKIAILVATGILLLGFGLVTLHPKKPEG